MKHSTQELYGIDPKDLREMSYYNALRLCKTRAEEQYYNLAHEKECISEWSNEKEEKIKYIKKAIKWCDEKLKEME